MFDPTLLHLPVYSPSKLRKLAAPIKEAAIREAIQFESSYDTEKKEYTPMYRVDDFVAALGKPGKEFASDRIKYKDGHKANNPNDMSPTIFKDQKVVVRNGSFEEIFRQFVSLVDYPQALELIGVLCVRNAYLLDHVEKSKGIWRYEPAPEVILHLKALMPANFPEPIEVFLAYIELIALNEDVKYSTLGFDLRDGTGRENNLLTYVHVIHILLLKGTVPDSEFLLAFVKFAGGLVRIPTGINSLALSNCLKYFPALRAE